MPAPDRPTPAPSPGDDAPPFRYTAALAGRIEQAWQAEWDRRGTFHTPNPGEPGFDASRPKKFILDMFPYPSGVGLHVGHPLGYIATDIYARYLRMTGHNVLHAMGFDAFGLPAEQYAVQTNTHPRVTTERNIATMRVQLRRLGLGHDAHRSVSTTDPEFYKWTQWIFLQIYNSWYDGGEGTKAPRHEGTKGQAEGWARPIRALVAEFEAGTRPIRDTEGKAETRRWADIPDARQREIVDSYRLAYLAEVPVNWCPMLGTVLANEEVIDGKSERGNYPVYKRPLKQWMMRITAYAERLLNDLDTVAWPEALKTMQRNWIGRSEGAYIDFDCSTRRIRVFTTRPDTLFGATYMVLSPEHEMIDHIIPEKFGAAADKFTRAIFPGAAALVAANAPPKELIAAYRAYAKSKSDDDRAAGKEKTGCFTGAFAVNPMNGARIPVFIADYVLAGYGTGAIMAVPGQDQRDWDFAAAFRLPIIRTVQPPEGFAGEVYTEDGPAINSGPLDGLRMAEAKQKMGARLEEIGRGQRTVNYKLRDWLFSRQRYWGEPFPIVFDERGIAHDVPESMLPVLLPEVDNFQPESSSDPEAPPRPPLARAESWVKATLDLGDGRGPRAFTRETNTMPNWAGSCWYYLRYLDPANTKSFVSPEAERYWMVSKKKDGSNHSGGVDLYVGGVEHAVLHLLYARFWHKVLFDLGRVSTPEPFGRLFNQGYIQAHAFQDERGAYVEAAQVTLGDGSAAIENQDKPGPFFFEGKPVTRSYGKMGKSLKNAATPDDVCAAYGCDTLRVYEMSMGPLEASKPWNTRDIAGAHRFLQRVWRNMVDEKTGLLRVSDTTADAALTKALHKTIAGVRKDMETLGFNTAVAKLIEFNNELTKQCGPDAGAGNKEGGQDVRPTKTGPTVPRTIAEPLVLMLAPLAPHMAEELWKLLGHGESLTHAPFPVADAALAADDQVEIPVQVLGKLRGKVVVPAGSDAAAIEAAAKADPKIAEQLAGKAIKKVIVVPGKLVNFVVA